MPWTNLPLVALLSSTWRKIKMWPLLSSHRWWSPAGIGLVQTVKMPSANWYHELADPPPPPLSQVFPGLWLLLSSPQWDYVGLWREEEGGALWFSSDLKQIKSDYCSSLWYSEQPSSRSHSVSAASRFPPSEDWSVSRFLEWLKRIFLNRSCGSI